MPRRKRVSLVKSHARHAEETAPAEQPAKTPAEAPPPRISEHTIGEDGILSVSGLKAGRRALVIVMDRTTKLVPLGDTVTGTDGELVRRGVHVAWVESA